MTRKRRYWEEDLDQKLPKTVGLVKKTYYNTNIEEIQNKKKARQIEKNPLVLLLQLQRLVLVQQLQIENKIPISNLDTKAASNAKTTEIEIKYPIPYVFILLLNFIDYQK